MRRLSLIGGVGVYAAAVGISIDRGAWIVLAVLVAIAVVGGGLIWLRRQLVW